jgi:hypothetical protein
MCGINGFNWKDEGLVKRMNMAIKRGIKMICIIAKMGPPLLIKVRWNGGSRVVSI